MRIILIVVSLAMLSAGCRQDPLAELREGAQGILGLSGFPNAILGPFGVFRE